MNLKLMNISQLSEATGADRATIARCLQDLKPVQETQNLKVYYSQIALPLILERTQKITPNWTEIIIRFVNGLNQKRKPVINAR